MLDECRNSWGAPMLLGLSLHDHLRKPALDLSDIVRPPGTGDYRRIVVRAMSARLLDLLGRAEQSSPNAALRRAEGAGLDCESADRAIINVSRCTSSSDTVREVEYQILQIIRPTSGML